jgi:hypothetical protein
MARKMRKGAKVSHKHAVAKKVQPRSFLERMKHWLKKKAQGLPMTTIVIIIIVLIVLAVVVIFFFGQFSTGQTTVEQQLGIGSNATGEANKSWQNFLKGI